jgi:hypothetical protein
MKKALLVLLAVAVVFTMLAIAKDNAASGTSMKGWISDAHCGAKGAHAGHEACAKKCAEMGEKLVFVPDAKDGKILSIDNQSAVMDHAGQHVQVEGSVNNGTLHVESVSMIAEK